MWEIPLDVFPHPNYYLRTWFKLYFVIIMRHPDWKKLLFYSLEKRYYGYYINFKETTCQNWQVIIFNKAT